MAITATTESTPEMPANVIIDALPLSDPAVLSLGVGEGCGDQEENEKENLIN